MSGSGSVESRLAHLPVIALLLYLLVLMDHVGEALTRDLEPLPLLSYSRSSSVRRWRSERKMKTHATAMAAMT